MPALLWTRGPDLRLSYLESRLKCPKCASPNVTLMFRVPSFSAVQRAKPESGDPFRPADLNL
jgi:hypothetical protein